MTPPVIKGMKELVSVMKRFATKKVAIHVPEANIRVRIKRKKVLWKFVARYSHQVNGIWKPGRHGKYHQLHTKTCYVLSDEALISF